MLAAPVVASDGMSTSPVRSYLPSSKAPETTPPRSAVTGSLVSQHSITATSAGNSDNQPKWNLAMSW